MPITFVLTGILAGLALWLTANRWVGDGQLARFLLLAGAWKSIPLVLLNFYWPSPGLSGIYLLMFIGSYSAARNARLGTTRQAL